jgi:uncharacterized membrane protein
LKTTLDRLYRIGLWIKGLDGILEIAGGLVLLLVSQPQLGQLVTFLTQRELVEDPRDWIAGHLRDAVHQLSPSTKLFASMYLLIHGVVKLCLIVALLRQWPWSYRPAIAVLLAFIAYQVYQLSLHVSLALLLVSVLDAAIVLLVWREYRQVSEVTRRRGRLGRTGP